MKGILLAVLISSVFILIFFRSTQLTFLSLLVPLVFAAGLMGFFGIPLKVSTALVFTIIYGIAVDDTIHFLNSFRVDADKTSTSTAIRLALQKMTEPMIYTSFVLFTGFMIFSLSGFMGIKSMGILVSTSLLVAVITDLVLLSVLLQAFKRKRSLAITAST